MLNRLQAGAGTYACGGYLAGLGSLQRSEICTALLFSRLERKMRMVDALREEASENWNQTFYLLYSARWRPPEPGGVPLAGTPRPLQGRPGANGWRRGPSKPCSSGLRGC